MTADEQGTVVWITGLPGAGKSTVAREVFRLLRERTPAVARLDGDLFRDVMGGDLGYGLADRLENARRISRMCRMLSEQGLHVVCATVSLFRECHEWNRANLPRYVEVFLRIRRETFLARNQKGLVSRALSGGAGEVVGVDQPYDEPTSPDLVADTDDGAEPPGAVARRIVELALP
ncbi:MAG: adenylyl-sulfate kinase [Planctomycetes bacterium]|nr:adenylyl-sulfate kinase [Planctomycetota bacterium]